MAYETPEGQEIKRIIIKIETLQSLFTKYGEKFPFELVGALDNLEYEIVSNSKVLD